ncbi:MAG: hypothetical protein KDC03_20395, partial [Flavobacteriales bacterium]|nr:hypothetical protein [Flavobacteriales bacterium]
MRHQQLSFALVLLVICSSVNAQVLDWATPLGTAQQEIAYDVAVDPEGSVITVGTFTVAVDLDPGPGVFTVTPNGSSDIFIRKQDIAGNFLWGGSLGGNNADVAHSVSTDGNGNIVVTGRVGGSLDMDIGPGVQQVSTLNTTYDVFVMKLSSSGALLWAHVFGSLNNDAGHAVAIGPGGVIVTTGILGASGDMDPGAGVANEGGNGMDDVFVQALDASGNYLWSATVGGTLNDQGLDLDVDGNGNVLVTGTFQGTIDLNPGLGSLLRTSAGNSDIFVLKLNGSGILVWGQAIGGTGTETAHGIAAGPAGQVVLTGQLTSATDMDPGSGTFILPASFTEDAFLLQWDQFGSFEWAFLLKS